MFNPINIFIMNKFVMYAAVALAAMASLTSCDNTPNVVGTWTGNPQPLNDVAGAFKANSIDVLTFAPDGKDNLRGTVTISSMISAQQAITADPEMVEPYQQTVAATAQIQGTWAYSTGEDDEIDIVLDYGTLQVNVDPSGVAFSSNMLTGKEQPQIDSLTQATAQRWTVDLNSALLPYYSRYVSLDDVKVKDNNLKFEVSGEKNELVFHGLNK